MCPEFKSRGRRHMWVEFVVGSLFCCERFFSGYSSFPLSSKIHICKFQFNQESGRQRCATSKLLLLLLLLLLLSSSLSLLFHDCEKVEKMFWFCDLFMIKVHYFTAVRRDAKIEVSERGTNINCQLKVYERGTFCL